MLRHRPVGAQLKALAPWLPLGYTVTLLLLLAVTVQEVVPPVFLLRDPANVADYPFYIGLLSNIGVLLWGASAAICLFTARAIRGRVEAAYLAAAGLLTTLLTVDDLFLLHEDALPIYLHIPERLVLGSYVVLTLVFLLRFARLILRTDYLPLLFALGFFAVSAVVDVWFSRQSWAFWVEDGLKLLGIVSWLMYFTRICLQLLPADPAGRPGEHEWVGTELVHSPAIPHVGPADRAVQVPLTASAEHDQRA